MVCRCRFAGAVSSLCRNPPHLRRRLLASPRISWLPLGGWLVAVGQGLMDWSSLSPAVHLESSDAGWASGNPALQGCSTALGSCNACQHARSPRKVGQGGRAAAYRHTGYVYRHTCCMLRYLLPILLAQTVHSPVVVRAPSLLCSLHDKWSRPTCLVLLYTVIKEQATMGPSRFHLLAPAHHLPLCPLHHAHSDPTGTSSCRHAGRTSSPEVRIPPNPYLTEQLTPSRCIHISLVRPARVVKAPAPCPSSRLSYG